MSENTNTNENINLGLLFRHGEYKNLKDAQIINGSINFTTDEPAIYLDFDGKRQRIGDVIVVST
jgi:hypothetical protein